MSQLLKVRALSKFGFFVEGEDKGVYFDRSLPESERGKFVPGATIEAELRVAESGTKYVTAVVPVVNGGTAMPKIVAPIFKDTPLVKDMPGVATLTAMHKKLNSVEPKTDWAAKDRSQLIGGLSHDAAELAAASVAYNVPISSVVDQYKLALVALIKIREEVK